MGQAKVNEDELCDHQGVNDDDEENEEEDESEEEGESEEKDDKVSPKQSPPQLQVSLRQNHCHAGKCIAQ